MRRLPGRPQVLYRQTRIKPPSNPVDRWRYSRRLKVFERLIFVSRAAREEFLTDYPGFVDRAVVVCNPIDVETWPGDAENKEKLILSAGRAIEEKGLDALCAALAETLDKEPAWRAALMLGDWDRHRDWAEPHVAAILKPGGLLLGGNTDKIADSLELPAFCYFYTPASLGAAPSRMRFDAVTHVYDVLANPIIPQESQGLCAHKMWAAPSLSSMG